MVVYGVMFWKKEGDRVMRYWEDEYWPLKCLRKPACNRRPWVSLRQKAKKIGAEAGVIKVVRVIVCLKWESKMAKRKSKKSGLRYPCLSVWPAVSTAMPFCMLLCRLQ